MEQKPLKGVKDTQHTINRAPQTNKKKRPMSLKVLGGVLILLTLAFIITVRQNPMLWFGLQDALTGRSAYNFIINGDTISIPKDYLLTVESEDKSIQRSGRLDSDFLEKHNLSDANASIALLHKDSNKAVILEHNVAFATKEFAKLIGFFTQGEISEHNSTTCGEYSLIDSTKATFALIPKKRLKIGVLKDKTFDMHALVDEVCRTK